MWRLAGGGSRAGLRRGGRSATPGSSTPSRDPRATPRPLPPQQGADIIADPRTAAPAAPSSLLAAPGWGRDVAASVVVALVALPLCLGIALASGAPLMSGLIAGIIGGLVVGTVSASPLSVSGPAAGLTVIVLGAIAALPSFEAFLLAVVLSGVFQLAVWLSRTAWLSEFVPSSVITGMLAAIGLILILKQLPHAIGYDGDFEGSFAFLQPDGLNTVSTLAVALESEVLWGAALIAGLGVAFLFWWDGARPADGPLRFLPGPLIVVLGGVLLNTLFAGVAPALALPATHLVQVPVTDGLAGLAGLLRFPDLGAIGNPVVWTTALTLALVATLETLLSINAVDRLDPRHRITDKNREMLAQGAGNIASGLIGGLPLTAVIVRSSANADAGAVSKRSAIIHGAWLLGSVALIPALLNTIPLAALAAVLLFVGYKLARPALFVERWRQGWTQFVPFLVTVVGILFTDLLVGIVIGIVVGFVFVIARNFRTAVTVIAEGEDWLIRARRNLYFIHKPELKAAFARVPDGARVLIDLSNTNWVDLDNVEIVNNFVAGADRRGIDVSVRGDAAGTTVARIHARQAGVRYA